MTTRPQRLLTAALVVLAGAALAVAGVAIAPQPIATGGEAFDTGGPISVQDEANWIRRAPKDVRAGKFDESCGRDPCEDPEPKVRDQDSSEADSNH